MNESEWKDEIRVREGGLMRCCIESIRLDTESRTTPPKEGEILVCRIHQAEPDDSMVFRAGAWEWAKASKI
jgi:hypothetical protein